MISNLEIVGFHSARHVAPAVKDLEGTVIELAVGDMVSEIYLRGPSGRTYIAKVPHELIEEIQKS